MRGAPPITTTSLRVERFERVGSTSDIVRSRLAAGEPEICVAVAGEQTAGRGRRGRTWTAPAGAALLVSLGFRPTWLAPGRTWRLAAAVTLAMADAAEDVAGLPVGSIRCKWPNDLVIETRGPNALLTGVADAADAAARLAAPLELRKLAGVLGESEGLGTDDPRVVIGIGINADWPAADFPPALAPTMTSLREASAGRPIDREALLEEFLDRLDGRIEALRAGFFDLDSWAGRQAVTGRQVTFEEAAAAAGTGPTGAGDELAAVRVMGLDMETGGLVVEDPAAPSGERIVHAGEIARVRIVAGQV